MQTTELIEPRKEVPIRSTRWPLIISRVSSAIFLILFTVSPLCYCPSYYLKLSLLGLLPLFLGPQLYRWLGAAIIFAGLAQAEADRRAAIWQREESRKIQAQAEAQFFREHPERRPTPDRGTSSLPR